MLPALVPLGSVVCPDPKQVLKLVMLPGRYALVIFVPAKAADCTVVTLLDMYKSYGCASLLVIFSILEHLKNALLLIFLKSLVVGKITFTRLVQPSNALLPNSVTLPGIVTTPLGDVSVGATVDNHSRLAQFLNALFGIVLVPLGRTTVLRLVQSWNT